MRIAVIGAGIVGATTAYELAADGHAVVVFERRASVATESSFANTGVIAPGYAVPWAAPGMRSTALAGLLTRRGAVRFGGGALSVAPWLWRFFRACAKAEYELSLAQMQALARYSQDRTHELTSALKLQYEQTYGYMVLLRSARDLARASGSLAMLNHAGQAHRLLAPAEARVLEPGLSPVAPLHAAIHFAEGGTGNCRQFAHQIKSHAQALGAEFHFGCQVQALKAGAPVEVTSSVAGSSAAAQTQSFDAAVICTGARAPKLLHPIGVQVPILPVYGYSVTVPLRHRDDSPDLGPQGSVMDERYKVDIARLGQRIRVAGIAEIGGHPSRFNNDSLRQLYDVLEDWFPGAAEIAKAQHWKGARPMLPDGPPIVGPSGAKGIWLNLGHGASGWALSNGSARVLADLIQNRAPGVDISRLHIGRFR